MTMNRRTLLATGASAATLAALGLPVRAQDAPLKVGFIYVGPIGDGGWTYQHDQGRLAVEEEFGDRVETIYQESVPEGADAERAITQMILSGAGLIFTTSFGFMDATVNVAEQFPDVKFEHATGYKRLDNLATYDARFYEGRAVIGHIAGRMTQTNKIGYIASFPIPEVIQGINSAFLHARKVNPEVEMVVIWAYTWFDPAKEADAAKAMIEQGVDVIMQHTDSTAPQAAAQEAGNVFTFGQAVGHGAVQAHAARLLDHRQLGALLHQARAGGARRHLDLDPHLGRHRGRRGGDRRDHRGRARRREGRGRGAARLHRLGRVPPLHRSRSTSRTARPGWPRGRWRPTRSSSA
jgi:basic membrane lipoprotein Med (substrate-binding protein (PBP1-ABC) superfamily)